jgi:uncharacterized protein YutE (UPF0331/DUF86 family)
MNRARIEELVARVEKALAEGLYDHERDEVRAALTTLARECYEEAAKMCDDENIMPGSHYADAIRALAEEVGK